MLDADFVGENTLGHGSAQSFPFDSSTYRLNVRSWPELSEIYVQLRNYPNFFRGHSYWPPVRADRVVDTVDLEAGLD